MESGVTFALFRSKSGSFRSGSVSPQSWGWEAVQESPGTESSTANMMNTSATSLESGFLVSGAGDLDSILSRRKFHNHGESPY